MRKMISYGRHFIASGLVCLMLFVVPAVSVADASAKVLTVGVVPQFDISRIQTIWRPILDEMEKRTGLKFVLSGAATIPAFERDLIQGEYDLAYINPYQVVRVGERQGYQPLVRDVSQNLYGIVVVPSNSPIQSVEQLKNQVVAFPAPNALGATLLVRAELYDRYGVEVVPRYVLSHSSVYLNVVLDEVVAGGGVQKTLNRQSEALQSRLRVLYKTASVPSHPVVVHRRVPAQIRRQLLDAMLALGQDAVGRELLSAVPIAKLGVAETKDYQALTEMALGRFQ
ncbi:MAG TPA: phosphate/phosphite/phosphonate ABC transporter substrate-binding protein [Candidatus Tenderia electrophaga]|uniref:Phosphate/phosphite/phosphonate ABC transporter substrate-binding protein n=1 Tax=Candidatus Tenderia electrophaga TaxID=1748243 RepID=A0A832J6J4_9GAMM|nr:phosphate/phosphite/phosphonate ABC transporter substrate-binding protein [Candidatus Tenderia electrophaga]